MAAPWFKIYSQELLADPKAKLLTHDQLGKLLLLWCYANEDGCCIPSDPQAIGCLLGIANKNQMVNQMVWIRRFFVPVEGDETRLVSLRLLEERQAYDEKCAKLRANGSRGGRPRKPDAKPNGYPDGFADGNQMAPEEGRGKKEKENPPTPPSGLQGAPQPLAPVEAKPLRQRRPRGQAQAEAFKAYSPAAVELTKAVLAETPREDEGGRMIRTDPALLVERLDGLLANPDLTPDILLRSWRAYVGGKPSKLKAPQYFFGKQGDNGDNAANWRPFAKLIYTATARKPAPAPAEPLPLEPAV